MLCAVFGTSRVTSIVTNTLTSGFSQLKNRKLSKENNHNNISSCSLKSIIYNLLAKPAAELSTIICVFPASRSSFIRALLNCLNSGNAPCFFSASLSLYLRNYQKYLHDRESRLTFRKQRSLENHHEFP